MKTYVEAVAEFAKKLESSGQSPGKKTFVAVAYWCDESWAICAGYNRDEVLKAADIYCEMWSNKFNADGEFVNGHGTDGYWIMEVPEIGRAE